MPEKPFDAAEVYCKHEAMKAQTRFQHNKHQGTHATPNSVKSTERPEEPKAKSE